MYIYLYISHGIASYVIIAFHTICNFKCHMLRIVRRTMKCNRNNENNSDSGK